MGLATSSGELIDEYGCKQSVKTSTNTDRTNAAPNNFNRYAPKDFKEFMGYEEPDYLQVAGLYASMEKGKHSKVYGGFLVKGADYVAEKLGWYNKDGKLDVKRADTAIRTACRKKNSEGLCYMYSQSNKNHCLSDKGGSRIYMPGRRYQQLKSEHLALEAKYNGITSSEKMEQTQGQSDFDKVRRMVLQVATLHGLASFGEGAVVWVTKMLLSKLDKEEIQWYFELLASKVYRHCVINDRNCPQINGIFDIFNKHDKIASYADRKSNF